MNGAELWVRWKLLGSTVADLAELLDLNPRTLTRWMQRDEPVPQDVADRVERHVNRHLDLVTDIRERFVDDWDGAEPVRLLLLNRQEDVPDWAEAGTSPEDWNNAVVAVYRDALDRDTLDPSDFEFDWRRHADT